MSNSATPWTVACQAPLSMEFSRQEHWSGWVAISSSRRSSQPRDWAQSPASSALAGRFFITVPPGKPFKDSSSCLLLLIQTEGSLFHLSHWHAILIKKTQKQGPCESWPWYITKHQKDWEVWVIRMAFITTQSALTNITQLTYGKLEWDITT